MAINLNSYGACGTDSRGSGTRPCDLAEFGDFMGLDLWSKGTTLSVSTDTLNLSTYKDLIKGLKLFNYNSLYNFTQNTPENERSTSNIGVMDDNRQGKPQYDFQFKGTCLQKSLYAKKGFGKWDFGLRFDKGMLLARSIDGATISGFTGGMLSVGTFSLKSGSDPQTVTASIQLLDADEFNMYWEFFTWEQLGFNANKVNGVIDSVLTVETPISDGETSFNFKVTSACNVDDVIDSLDDETLLGLGGTYTGAVSAIVYNVDTENYTATVTPAFATGDTIKPFLKSSTFRVAEDDAGMLFKAENATTVTVTA